MFKKLLFSIVLVGTTYSAQLKYPLEKELIEVFDDIEMFDFDEKCAISNHAMLWLKQVINDFAAGRIKLTKEDEDYIQRVSWMICSIYENTEYMGKT